MKSLPNIEASVFRRGEYVGYSRGVWLIRRTNSTYGAWIARCRDDASRATLYGHTLAQLSARLIEAERAELVAATARVFEVSPAVAAAAHSGVRP